MLVEFDALLTVSLVQGLWIFLKILSSLGHKFISHGAAVGALKLYTWGHGGRNHRPTFRFDLANNILASWARALELFHILFNTISFQNQHFCSPIRPFQFLRFWLHQHFRHLKSLRKYLLQVLKQVLLFIVNGILTDLHLDLSID